jgi:hypothetical protein
MFVLNRMVKTESLLEKTYLTVVCPLHHNDIVSFRLRPCDLDSRFDRLTTRVPKKETVQTRIGHHRY